jgi:predicted RNase H-like HicB family nuclease
MKVVYSVAIETGTIDIEYGVVVPDIIGCFSSGETFELALHNVKEAIEFHLESLALDGQLPPPSTSINDHMANLDFEGWVWSMVEIDITPYLGKSSKINVTLPNLLTKQIDDFVKNNETFVNRSQFLQEAARTKMESSEARI